MARAAETGGAADTGSVAGLAAIATPVVLAAPADVPGRDITLAVADDEVLDPLVGVDVEVGGKAPCALLVVSPGNPAEGSPEAAGAT